MYQTSRKTASHEDSIWAVTWPTEEQLITGSIDETVKVWKPAAEKISDQPPIEVTSTMPGHFLGVVSLSSSSDGRLCAVSSLDGRVKVWNVEKKTIQKTIDPGPVEAWAVAFHPQGSLIASGSQSGHINVFAVADKTDSSGDNNKPEHTIDPKGKFILSVAYSPCGRLIASGAQDGVVCLIDSASGNLIRKLEGHNKAVRSLSWASDSKTLLTASEDMTILMHDVSAPAAAGGVAALHGHDSWVLSVAHSPTGAECVSGGSDKRVRVWDLKQRQPIQTIQEHTDQVWGVAYNPSGTKFVSIGDDGSVIIGSQ